MYSALPIISRDRSSFQTPGRIHKLSVVKAYGIQVVAFRYLAYIYVIRFSSS